MFSSPAILPPRTKRWAEATVLADSVSLKVDVTPCIAPSDHIQCRSPPTDLQTLPISIRIFTGDLSFQSSSPPSRRPFSYLGTGRRQLRVLELGCAAISSICGTTRLRHPCRSTIANYARFNSCAASPRRSRAWSGSICQLDLGYARHTIWFQPYQFDPARRILLLCSSELHSTTIQILCGCFIKTGMLIAQ
jgi:hypothetical protein